MSQFLKINLPLGVPIVAQWVKGLVLLQLWDRLLLWLGFSPWPRNFHMPQVWPKEFYTFGVPVMAWWKQIQLGTMRLQVQSLALLSGLRIRRCRELWCRSQIQLGSRIAVALV